MTAGAALAVVLLSSPARASSPFIDDLRKAEAREPADPERVEFATRAIRAWTPDRGNALLGDAYLRRGEGRFAQWDDAGADADLSRALELDGGADAAVLLRARARLRAGAFAKAEADFAEAAARRADDGEAWLGLAEARVSRGLPRADRPALDAAAKAAKRLGADARVHVVVGRAHLAAGRGGKALEAFDDAVSASGDSLPEAWAWRARAKADLGDPRGAQRDGGRAAALLDERLDDRGRRGAPAPEIASLRAAEADALFRRGAVDERLSETSEALDDYDDSCALGRADACARAAALRPKDAPPPPPKPKKRRRVANPKDDPGDRIYAN